MKKKLLIAMLILAFIGIPSVGVLAAGESYLAFDSVKYPEGNEIYRDIISTSDGGYALTMIAESGSQQCYLRKYNANGALGFSYGYTLTYPVYYYEQAYCPLAQTADGGYLLAADSGVLVRLDASGKELWKKQLTGISDICQISIAPNGKALLSVSEAQGKANKILCVDENANVLWQKSRQDLGAVNAGTEFMYILPVITADGNFAALTYDNANSIVCKLDTNGNTLWKTVLPSYADATGSRYFFDMLGTSDGGLLLAGEIRGKSHILKLSADGRQLWSADNNFSNYQSERLNSVIETDDGYIAVGSANSITLMPKEDLYYYIDTILACYDKNGKVKYGKAFFEEMEVLSKIIKVSGNSYMALASASIDFSGLAKKDTGLIYFNTSANQPKTGWEKVGNDWYYRYYGLRVRGWQQIGGKRYWFGPEGKMATGWLKEAYSPWYYLKPDGSMTTGWEKVNGYWYYFKPDGAMSTGWIKDNSKWYYLDVPASYVVEGRMRTGWLKDGGNWYYLRAGGAMATGWEKADGSWYYFAPGGAMVTGRQTIGGRKCNFAASGKWLGYVS